MQTYICFFHFRVAVAFYSLLSGEGGILRHWGCCLQCQGSDEVQPGVDQAPLAQFCPIYGLCLAGPTAVETFLNH